MHTLETTCTQQHKEAHYIDQLCTYQHVDYQYSSLLGTEVFLLLGGVTLLGHQFLRPHRYVEAPQNAREDLEEGSKRQPPPQPILTWFT